MRNSVILDIGSSKITCLICSPGENSQVDVHGIGVCEYPGYRAGDYTEATLPDLKSLTVAIRRAVQQAEDEAKELVKGAIVSVDSPFLKTVVVQGELASHNKRRAVRENDSEKLMELANNNTNIPGYMLIYSSVPFKYYADGVESKTIPVGTSVFSLLADISCIYVSTEFDRLILQALKSVKIALHGYVATPLSEAHFLISSAATQNGTLLVDMGYTHTDVSYIFNDALIRTYIIPAGGKHFASDLMKVLNIPANSAESLKRRFAFDMDCDNSMESVRTTDGQTKYVAQAMIRDIIEARAEEFCDFIKICAENENLTAADDVLPDIAEEDELSEEKIQTTGRKRKNMQIDSVSQNSYNYGNGVYFTGGGVALMQGFAGFFERNVGITINADMPKVPRLNTHNYSSVFAAAAFVFNNEGINTDCTKKAGGIGSLFSNIFNS